MGIDQRSVDGFGRLSRQAEHRAAGQVSTLRTWSEGRSARRARRWSIPCVKYRPSGCAEIEASVREQRDGVEGNVHESWVVVRTHSRLEDLCS
jgi:hypothetical protein